MRFVGRPLKRLSPMQITDASGEVTITNDGATILKQMQVLHPAAKMVCARGTVCGEGIAGGHVWRHAPRLVSPHPAESEVAFPPSLSPPSPHASPSCYPAATHLLIPPFSACGIVQGARCRGRRRHHVRGCLGRNTPHRCAEATGQRFVARDAQMVFLVVL